LTTTRRSQLCAALLALAAGLPVSASTTEHRLTMDQRIAAQFAIEQVYWSHRIWPAENSTAKPPLSAVLPDAAIRTKVEDYLRESNAMDALWQRPITATQLQAEIDRMSKQTRDPRLLRELFAALGNDPFLIAETLGRQTLADRLIRSWYASDERFHGALKQQIERAVAGDRRAARMRSLGGEYFERKLVQRATAREASVQHSREQDTVLSADEWKASREALARGLGSDEKAFPIGRVGGIQEDTDSFSVSALLREGADELLVATVVWPKLTFDGWWSRERAELGDAVIEPSPSYVLTLPSTDPCVDDTWNLRIFAPSSRRSHTAVWTGSEMIVWGGFDAESARLATGGRYSPATDTWLPTALGAATPAKRDGHVAVWTGSEMIVWGGNDGPALDSGGRYNPASDSWIAMTASAQRPTARYYHTAVWTGSEMIVWGGYDGTAVLNTGARYNPTSDTWLATPTGAGVPTARRFHSAVWTGTLMIIWGGENGNFRLNNGSRFNPSTGIWGLTSVTGAPTARRSHSAVWTGTEMIVWGGLDSTPLGSGGRYNSSTNVWAPTTLTGAPARRWEHTAVWTGSVMIIWGGRGNDDPGLKTGSRYTPSTNSWAATSIGADVPTARSAHTAVWTGSEMIVWGGLSVDGYIIDSGGRFSPMLNAWVPTSTGGAPSSRRHHTAVWTGAEMIVWGGTTSSSLDTNTGGRYSLATDTWTPTPTGGSTPGARNGHSAVWTGTEMIVWGGAVGTIEILTGGRFNPTSQTWIATSTGANAPSARQFHTAVWTGTEMIVWGGTLSILFLNDGGRYNPGTDIWAPVSAGPNVPSPRGYHSAVWTGSEMIVWGGWDGSAVNSGGRYDPASDAWSATSTGTGVPPARANHTAVWNGSEMIVFGGDDGVILNSGARYQVASNTWIPMAPSARTPGPREVFVSVWTGNEMISWGGYPGTGLPLPRDGGRYIPTGDLWSPTSVSDNTPTGRFEHTAVWTGERMLIWGGFPFDANLGSYCAATCASPATYHPDLDGDGYGDVNTGVTACFQPQGYLVDGSDCNDRDNAVHPGAPEVCNGIDENCNQVNDDGAQPGEVSSVTVAKSGTDAIFSWPATPDTFRYDLLRGHVGDWPVGSNSATETCVANDDSDTSESDSAVPAAGDAYWYLVRAENVCGDGSYGSRGTNGGPGAPRTSSACP
jgi:hypothetical protein